MDFFKKEWFKIVISICLVFVVYISYQVLVITPRFESIQEAKRNEVMMTDQDSVQRDKEQKLTECTTAAHTAFRNERARICVEKYNVPSQCKAYISSGDKLEFGLNNIEKLSKDCSCEINKTEDMIYLGDLLQKAELAEKECSQSFE